MFANREEAGRLLAASPRLQKYKGAADAVVLGIPRGGMITAAAVASALALPIDVIVSRKISSDANPEFAIGAVTALGPAIWNQEACREFSESDLATFEKAARREALRRLKMYRHGKPMRKLEGKTVLIVDDGWATGLTVWAAALHAREARAKKVVVAAPVAPKQSLRDLKKIADEVIVLETPRPFFAVGQFYRDFPQVSDEEVMELLGKNRNKRPRQVAKRT